MSIYQNWRTAQTIDLNISNRLALANGKRRQRVLLPLEILQFIDNFKVSNKSYDFIHGGKVPPFYNYGAYTTICLIVRKDDGTFAMDIGVSTAFSPKPDLAWPELAPYGNIEKLKRWADDPNRIIVK